VASMGENVLKLAMEYLAIFVIPFITRSGFGGRGEGLGGVGKRLKGYFLDGGREASSIDERWDFDGTIWQR
jgi:hypothetical protein